MRHNIHNHPVLVQWDSSRWPDETSDSLGIYSYTICNLQKAERDGQNQYRPAMCKVCRESKQTPHGKRDHTAPVRDSCQPGHGSQKPAPTQGCARAFICTGQQKNKKKPDNWQIAFLSFSHGVRHMAGRLVSLDVPRLLKPTQTRNSYKNDRKHRVRGITQELREGYVSLGRSCTTWCNQLYPKQGERNPKPPIPHRAGNQPPEHP